MIGNFENNIPVSGFPVNCVLASVLSSIQALIFLERGFEFADADELHDIEVWKDAVREGKIVPLLWNKNYEDQSEQTINNVSNQGFTYEIYKGKYRFMNSFNYPLAYHQQVLSLSGMNMDFMFVDKNGNIVAYCPEGNEISGFTTSLIQFEKMNVGTGTAPTYNKVLVEMQDPKEFDYYGTIYQNTWNIKKLNLLPVTVDNIGEGSILFRVRDSIYGMPALGLTADDITIDDNAGEITFTGLTFDENGNYKATGESASLTYGEIVIAGDTFYGSGSYGSVVTGSIDIFGFKLLDQYTPNRGFFYVRVTDGGGTPIEGLGLSDFSLDSGTVLSVYNYGSGKYQVNIEKASITSGTMYVDNGDKQAESAYDVTDIGMFDNLSYLKISGSNEIPFANGGMVVDPLGTYEAESGEYRIITTVGGGASYIRFNEVFDGDSNRFTIDINDITSGELKIVNGSNNQTYTTTGSKTFDFTGDGEALYIELNTVNCRIANIQIEKL